MQLGKPFGVYGITLPQKESSKTEATPDAKLKQTIQVLSKATVCLLSRFYFDEVRQTKRLQLAK